MWKDNKFQPSPTRTYVAICYTLDFDGHYFRKFGLPPYGNVQGGADVNGLWMEGSFTPLYENTCKQASWYFTHVLNLQACVECCIPYEQYTDIQDQELINYKHRVAMDQILSRKTVAPKRKQ